MKKFIEIKGSDFGLAAFINSMDLQAVARRWLKNSTLFCHLSGLDILI